MANGHTVEPRDWESIERDYRMGVLTLIQICEKHGIPRATLTSRAQRERWTRDLAPRVEARTTAKLAQRELEAAGGVAPDTPGGEERALVEAASELQTRITVAHREKVGKVSALCEGMIAELNLQSMTADKMAVLIELLAMADGQEDDKQASPAAVQKRMAAIKVMLGLEARVETLKKLTDTMKTLVTLERALYGIDRQEKERPGPTPEQQNALQLTPNEAARRVAYLLLTATKQQGNTTNGDISNG